MKNNKIELKNWTDEQVLNWINETRKQLIAQNPQLLKGTQDQITEMVLDGMFEGFVRGVLRRVDLKRIAELMGYEVSEEFMNDPHPDPYDELNK